MPGSDGILKSGYSMSLALSTLTPPLAARSVSAAKSGAGRIPMIDAARFLASIAVVWLHTPRSALVASYSLSNVGYFAVPFFTMMAMFFCVKGVRNSPDRPFAEYARLRFTRLYVPFAVWVALYVLLRLALRHWFIYEDVPLDWRLLIVGTNGHPWFLPFVLVACLLAFGFTRLVLARPRLELPIIVIASVLAVAVALTPERFWQNLAFLVPPDYQDKLGHRLIILSVRLPAFFIGLAFALGFHRIPRRVWQKSAVGVAGLLITVGAMTAMCHAPHAVWRHVGGFGWLLMAMMPWQGAIVRLLSRLGNLTLGIYITHMALIEIVRGCNRTLYDGGTLATDLAVFAFAAIGSIILTKLLSRSRWTHWMLPITSPVSARPSAYFPADTSAHRAA